MHACGTWCHPHAQARARGVHAPPIQDLASVHARGLPELAGACCKGGSWSCLGVADHAQHPADLTSLSLSPPQMLKYGFLKVGAEVTTIAGAAGAAQPAVSPPTQIPSSRPFIPLLTPLHPTIASLPQLPTTPGRSTWAATEATCTPGKTLRQAARWPGEASRSG
jgi:hypothetical protein